jgi:Arc/MetJ family transcription regulator
MRTNIDIDDRLLAEAFRYVDVKTKKELVHLALEELVARRRRRDVRELRGTVGIRADYDYKSLRTGS